MDNRPSLASRLPFVDVGELQRYQSTLSQSIPPKSFASAFIVAGHHLTYFLGLQSLHPRDVSFAAM